MAAKILKFVPKVKKPTVEGELQSKTNADLERLATTAEAMNVILSSFTKEDVEAMKKELDAELS